MRKLFTLTLLLLLSGWGIQSVQAQCTVNPPSSSPGIYPNPLQNACVGQPYSEEVQFVFPLDTTVTAPPFGTFIIPFDSFEVLNVLSVPAGLTFTINSPTGKYYPQSPTVSARGCGNVTGTPTVAGGANDSVFVAIRAWATAPFLGVQQAEDTLGIAFQVLNSPVATFTATPAGGTTVNFAGSGGSSVTRLWTFGDGNTSTTQNPSHTYSSIGTYQVCYIMTNAGGCADTSCQVVTIGCPTPTSAWSFSRTGLNVNFTDVTLDTLSGWLWDFGDGNISTSQNPSHSYASPGTYTVCQTVTNACGTDSSCATVQVCDVIGSAISQSTSNLTVSFTDNSTGTPTSWAWDFGDGNTSTMQNPSHTYTNSGTYTVTLTVTNNCGDVSTSTVSFTICDAPVAGYSFTASGAGLTYDFTDASTGSSAAWAWDFGDGNTSTSQNPSHTYATDGNYTVCLTLTDSCGVSDTSCQNLMVVGIDQLENTSFEVFPNPAQDQIHLRASSYAATDLKVELLDVVGRKMNGFEVVGMNGAREFTLPLEGLKNGLYFLKVSTATQSQTFRFVKQ